jgi:glycosyltransferase involved in cell wall biosynthesis
MAQYKGLDVLYAALPSIARRVPHLHVVIAGEPVKGYAPPAGPQLPADVELVTHFRKVDTPTLRRLFQQACVVVAPYIEASQSGVVQTAFSFRKPVVASALGGLPEIVRDGVTGRLVPPGDAEALADAVAEVLLDDGLRGRMRSAIERGEASEFGWAPIARELLKVYAAVC